MCDYNFFQMLKKTPVNGVQSHSMNTNKKHI